MFQNLIFQNLIDVLSEITNFIKGSLEITIDVKNDYCCFVIKNEEGKTILRLETSFSSLNSNVRNYE